jgi:deoxycytidylate deaminase
MKRHTAFLNLAKYYASLSHAKKQHGAIVVKGNRIMGMGYNKNKNNPKYISEEHVKKHSSRHAEWEAMRDANWNVRGATLYVARTNRQGQDRNSEPCFLCKQKIKQMGIKKVIYTTGEKWISISYR